MADGLWGCLCVRTTAWAIAGCGLLAAAGLAAGPPRVQLDGNPAPSAGQVQAAQNKVNQRAAALGQQKERLAAANAKLTDLETKAEVLTEDYDKTVVEEQQAAMAYSTAVKKLASAQSAAESSQREVANLAAVEYETQGGFDPMAAMLGDAHGVQAYLNQVGLGQEFAIRSTDILATNNADSVVAGVFRSEASAALKARKADVRRAATLKTAIEAAVTRQLAAVKTTKSKTSQLSGLLQSAKITAQSLASQREAVLAAQAAAAAAAAEAAGQNTAPVAWFSRDRPSRSLTPQPVRSRATSLPTGRSARSAGPTSGVEPGLTPTTAQGSRWAPGRRRASSCCTTPVTSGRKACTCPWTI